MPETQSPFPALVITSVHFCAFGWNKQTTVPNGIYGYGAQRVPTVLDALEVVFRQLNHVDGTELISQPEYDEFRSLSVGDRVTFRGPGGWRRTFLCEAFGWSLVD